MLQMRKKLKEKVKDVHINEGDENTEDAIVHSIVKQIRDSEDWIDLECIGTLQDLSDTYHAKIGEELRKKGHLYQELFENVKYSNMKKLLQQKRTMANCNVECRSCVKMKRFKFGNLNKHM